LTITLVVLLYSKISSTQVWKNPYNTLGK
jgi:hypothetical protein